MTTRFGPVREQIRQRANERSTLTFPESDATHGLLMLFREYRYTPTAERGFAQFDSGGQNTIKNAILLPLPANISDNYDLRVERFDQGIFGDSISQAAQSFSSGSEMDFQKMLEGMGVPGTENLVRATSTMLGGAMGFLASRTPGAAVVGAVIGDALGTGTVASSLEAGAGALANPKAALQFKGIEMKRHSFDWTLVPRSQTESDRIEEIIRTIKKNVLPSYGDLGQLQRALLKYPSFVDCFFVGLDPVHYFRFKTSMVQSFNVNYSPNGNAILREGRPAAVQMTMTMIESDIHTSGDYGGDE
jgi:hypothetical protein